MPKKKPKVFVVNNSAHDFSDAKNYGKLVFLSEGSMNKYSANNMHRKFIEKLRDSKSNDYIVPCALSTMNLVACSTFAAMHGRLNLLLFKRGIYVERTLIFKEGL
jgi:hypothetical protein